MHAQAVQHAAALKEAQQLLAWLTEQQATDAFAQEEAAAAAAEQACQLQQQDQEIAALHEQLVGHISQYQCLHACMWATDSRPCSSVLWTQAGNSV